MSFRSMLVARVVCKYEPRSESRDMFEPIMVECEMLARLDLASHGALGVSTQDGSTHSKEGFLTTMGKRTNFNPRNLSQGFLSLSRTVEQLVEVREVIQEEELLTIKVKPGWKKGTKITFEGMGNERPGSLPADVIFIIGEKRHHLFRREGDDLEVVVRIPLIKALAGCDISIPLLGGEKMSLKIDDIIHPGYLKIIEGEGMPCPKEQRKRGDLKVVFLVDFPTTLTDQQRSDVVSILQDSVE
ncbi:mitochondrial protein import protein MAS5-like [Tripterygium wilfordii]|uniref:Mitochondrial protein import protein MAS5-like n=1 Tax=Tripterygium wilfordii TaxID=458696 RepID=A0A7J7CNC8_TRIWF|nr:mitochondrial protein import protein MAS5-like [Tripterygium wilfordii]